MTSKNILIALLVLLAIVCSGLIVYFWQTIQINNLSYQWQLEKALLEKQISDLQQQLVVQDDNVEQDDSRAEAWTQYSLDKYGLVFEYPENYSVIETDHYIAPTIKIISSDFSSELVGTPLEAIIKGNSFYLETWTSSVDIDLDKIINDRLNSSGQMTVPDQGQITKQQIGNFEFGIYTVNGYDEALFYDEVTKRGWKVVFETENPEENHYMFIDFLQGIDHQQDWLTYYNDDYKFSIKHPQDTEISTNTDLACISLGYKAGYILIDLGESISCGRKDAGPEIISKELIFNINGKEYKSFGTENYDPRMGDELLYHNETFVVNLEEKIDPRYIEFGSDYHSSQETYQDYLAIRNDIIKMVESFKFINDEYPDWLTYTDSTYNYQLNYPEGWITHPINSWRDGRNSIWVQFDSPDGQYTFTFGIRRKDETIRLLGRRGTTEIPIIKADTVNIAEVGLPVYGLLINDQISEFMAADLQEGVSSVVLDNISYLSIDSEYEVAFNFMRKGYSQPVLTKELEEYQVAKAILESFSFLE